MRPSIAQFLLYSVLQVVETVEVLTELSVILARAAGRLDHDHDDHHNTDHVDHDHEKRMMMTSRRWGRDNR